MKLKIAVIDSDIRTERLLRALLEKDYELHCRFSSADSLSDAAKLNPDIIIIDPLYPKRNGADFIKSVREWSNCPIIAVSENTTEHAAVAALGAGADDYVRKPFYPAELKARIDVCARRIKAEASKTEAKQSCYYYDGLLMDYASRRVSVNGKEIRLTKNEFKILSLLCRHGGKVLTHEFIMKSVWGQGADCGTGILRVNIANLRRKLADGEGLKKYILTESGVGYSVHGEQPLT